MSATTELISAWPSPVGMLYIGVADGGVVRCDWRKPDAPLSPPDHVIADVITQLTEYFDRRRQSFTLPLNPRGTQFSLKVWRGLLNVPYGTTISYSDLAQSIGLDRRYSRAVANAVGANKLSILIPCHRIIRNDHTLGGYRGDPDAKRGLLTLELMSGPSEE